MNAPMRTRARTGEPDPRAVAETVTDPELLGVLRDVRVERDGAVVVEITPTYTGCPAMGVMRADLVHALHVAGFDVVDVRTVLSPAWSTDWITEAGRRKLTEAGIAPPGPAPDRPAGPVPLELGPPRRTASCPPTTPRSSASSAPRRARRCAAAGAAGSPSST